MINHVYKKRVLLFTSLTLFLLLPPWSRMNHGADLFAQASDARTLTVKKTVDFEITGDGSTQNWSGTQWLEISQRTFAGGAMSTKIKILYSGTGLYFLFQCEDRKLTSAMKADFLDLWKEDVAEIFLWTDETHPVYFEYEISPLNYELPILISNDDGDLVRWQPFHYDADRKTRHATAVRGGEKKSNGSVTGWSAEFFIPYKLLRPLGNIQPRSGTQWRANFYRVDYDSEGMGSWSWQLTRKNFHDYEKFGVLLFE